MWITSSSPGKAFCDYVRHSELPWPTFAPLPITKSLALRQMDFFHIDKYICFEPSTHKPCKEHKSNNDNGHWKQESKVISQANHLVKDRSLRFLEASSAQDTGYQSPYTCSLVSLDFSISWKDQHSSK